MKRLIVDVDDTICKTENGDYKNSLPNKELIEKLRSYQANGFVIVLMTSRNMRTYSGNLGLINVDTLPTLIDWLQKHCVPYDEIHMAKPWCGFEGFYVDDKSIRPSEFSKMSYEEIRELLAQENPSKAGDNK
jgi:capsule biosynthesis phosphatase